MPRIKDLPGFARFVVIQAQLLGMVGVGLVFVGGLLPFALWQAGATYDDSYFWASFWFWVVGLATAWVCSDVEDRVEDEIIWGEYGY